MKKFSILWALLAILSFASCEESDIISEIDNGFEEVLLSGRNIAGVWAIIENKIESDFIDHIVDELYIVNGDMLEEYKATRASGYGFKDNYLYECSLDDYETETSAMFYVVGNKAYIGGLYAGDLEVGDDNTLLLVQEDVLTVLKRVNGFKKYDLPSSGKADENGLPIPLDNEIYYRTSDGKQLAFSVELFTLSHTYDESKNCGRIVYPNAVEFVGVFQNCTTLTDVNIPNSISSIGQWGFYNCSSLTSITIPQGVTSIGLQAFYFCQNMAEVYCKPTTPPTGNDLMFSYYDDYDYCYKPIGCKIYVPTESVEAYKTAAGWSYYADNIEAFDFE